MDNPTVIDDKNGNCNFQTHKLGRPLERFQENFGLAITHAARNQRGGPLILDGKIKRKFEFYCISHLIEGKGILWSESDGSVRHFEAGSAVLVTPGYVHLYGGDDDIYVEDTICFAGRVADTLLEQGFLSEGIYDLGRARRVAAIIEHIMNPTVEEQLRAAVMLEKLLLDIYHETRELSQMGAGRIGCLLNEIQRQPEKWWTVTEMAELCSLSETHFRRIFREYTGLSPKDYLDHYKIRLAQEQLVATTCTLAEIAGNLGYLDPFHLSRRFKALTGLSPREYRTRHFLNS